MYKFRDKLELRAWFMKIPLAMKIRKQAQKDIALAQDLMTEEMYRFFPKAVFHGGTAIWRCYQGNRFSEDIDVYLPDKKNIPEFFQHLFGKGFVVHKQRVKDNSLYSLLEFNRAQVRFEALFVQKQGILKEYELADGNLITVYCLSAENLLREKIAACLKRRKVRDLYDIYFLLRYNMGKKPADLKKVLTAEIVDAENLPALILSGPIPTIKQMKEYIAQWEK